MIRDLVARALESEGLGRDPDEVTARIKAGSADLWAGKRSIMVTEWVERPDGLSLNVWLGAGDLDELLAMAPRVMAWAKARGCVEVTIEGRRGWVRALKGLGFEERAVTVGRRL